ncbi:MAG: ribosome assembly cofactor RimP [Bacteroidia bacterium]|nr:ribosome assembly cofactor RimP [Bacteroidia bacterium]
MIAKERIEKLIEEKLQGTELFLIELKISQANRIEVFIDGLNGLTIKDCVGVSRHIESSLDREVEDFELSVSSPGAEQPFKVNNQYLKNIGRKVEVITYGGQTLEGILVQATENEVEIESSVKRKKEIGKGNILVKEKTVLNKNQIKQTKVVLSFK